ncbi:MarR family winged helix-turn-helix transcriptional regulator [Streptomyces sp. NPDC001848]|uniref:MarR family winged helix-turn-helix transcriptional regulator n=1 Tax=Streptomyces sp. NPDC001848 TaxID=3364618 RepID=UPI00369F88F7
MVERLESLDLIDRRVNPDNRRQVVLRLTPVGAELVDRVLSHRRAEIRTLVERLPAQQRAGLVLALRALTDAADDLGLDLTDETTRLAGLVGNPLTPAPYRPRRRPGAAVRAVCPSDSGTTGVFYAYLIPDRSGSRRGLNGRCPPTVPPYRFTERPWKGTSA